MPAKRLTLEPSVGQYEFVRKEAATDGLTVSGFNVVTDLRPPSRRDDLT